MYSIKHGMNGSIECATSADVLEIVDRMLSGGYSNILIVRKESEVVTKEFERNVPIAMDNPDVTDNGLAHVGTIVYAVKVRV